MQNAINKSASEVISTYVYNVSLGSRGRPNFSYAAGVGIFQSVVNLIILLSVNKRTFFQSSGILPLREAALIDGADDFRFFFRILLPLSGAVIAVNCLFFAVGSWFLC